MKYAKALQMDLINDVQALHWCTSEEEFAQLFHDTVQKWSSEVPDFCRYFCAQWNCSDGIFTHWKLYNRTAGVAVMNNPVETFNAVVKKYYTERVRHQLIVMLKIFIEDSLPEIGRDNYHEKRPFEVLRKPSVKTRKKVVGMNADTYDVRQLTPTIVAYRKKHTSHSVTHTVNLVEESCTCKPHVKDAYCKHLVHALESRNLDGQKVYIKCVFKCRGNTAITKRQRGRERIAAAALQVM